MDRKEFLITIWEKGMKPILFLGVIIFCIKFLVDLFTENGPERLLTIGVIGIVMMYTIIYLLGELLNKTTNIVISRLPDSVKFWIRVSVKMMDYIAPILFGILIYHSWKKDWIGASIILGIVLIERINNIIKEEKQATT